MKVEVRIVYKRIVVPTAGGDSSWRAVRVGAALAARCGAELEVYSVVPRLGEMRKREDLLRARLAVEHPKMSLVKVSSEMADGSIATTIARHLAAVGSALPVMATAGHGRSEPLLGSVAEELLALTHGPVVVVGPHVDTERSDFTGDIVVPVDGSERSEAALWPASLLARQLGLRPWLTSVVDPGVTFPPDLNENSYAARLAARLQDEIGREVEFEMLHDAHPARAIVEFADKVAEASMIVASTHGRTGLARLAIGSVAMAIVHHAHVPVLLVRPVVGAMTAESVAVDTATT